MKLVVRMKFGSHLYGTETPQSDLDYKGVFIPGARDILLQRAKGAIMHAKNKAAGEKNKPGDVDDEWFSLHRFLELLGEGQTNALDMIFAPDQAIIEKTPIWDALVASRSQFLTRRAAAFVGYCRQQANKYGIKGSRVAVMREASQLFERLCRDLGNTTRLKEISGEFEAFVIRNPEHSALIDITNAGRTIRHFEVCGRKLPYTIHVKNAYDICKAVFDEYGQRARAAEENKGIDWKALSHAVRVGHEALELLSVGHITFPLRNRNHIKAIKTGKLPYETVASEIEQLLIDVEKAAELSILPDTPNVEAMESFICRVYLASIMEEVVCD